MLLVLFHDPAEMPFAEEYEVVETLIFYRFYKALGDGIAIWTFRGDLHRFNAARPEDLPKGLGEKRIAIVDEMGGAQEKSVDSL